jgi:ribosome recycling factor
MIDEVVAELKKEMEGTLGAFRRDLSHTRTGRASGALLEGIHVDYYGTKSPLNQVAGISVPEPRLIVLSPYDKSALSNIEKAIQTSDLGLTPMNDGKVIRIPIPELTEERRKDLVKHVRKVGEEYRVSMRNHRRDAIEMLKQLVKDKEITEDDERRAHTQVEEVTRDSIARVDKVLKSKEDEIMEV